MAKQLTEKTRDRAVDALEGMRQIVRREMVGRVGYISDTVVNERLAKSGAICGGHKACAIGSLWLGYGIKPEPDRFWTNAVELPGSGQHEREQFVAHRPGLRVALAALNEAADEMRTERGWGNVTSWNDPIEDLFEGHWGEGLDRRDLLSVIATAKRKVKNPSWQS